MTLPTGKHFTGRSTRREGSNPNTLAPWRFPQRARPRLRRESGPSKGTTLWRRDHPTRGSLALSIVWVHGASTLKSTKPSATPGVTDPAGYTVRETRATCRCSIRLRNPAPRSLETSPRTELTHRSCPVSPIHRDGFAFCSFSSDLVVVAWFSSMRVEGTNRNGKDVPLCAS